MIMVNKEVYKAAQNLYRYKDCRFSLSVEELELKYPADILIACRNRLNLLQSEKEVYDEEAYREEEEERKWQELA